MGFPVYDLGLWFETQCRLPGLIGSKALDFGIVSLGLSEVLVDGGLWFWETGSLSWHLKQATWSSCSSCVFVAAGYVAHAHDGRGAMLSNFHVPSQCFLKQVRQQ